MFCSRCGVQVLPNAAFCSKCGAPAAAPAVSPAAPSTQTSGPLVIKRPTVVSILAVLHLVGAAFWILVGLGGFGAMFATPESGGAIASGVIMLTFAGFGALQLFCGIGLLRLRSYGRTLQLGLAWIGLLGIPVGTIISILILIYFFKPGIKLIFAGRPGDDFTEQEIAQIKDDTTNSGAMIAVIVVIGVLLLIMIVAIMAAITVPAFLRARTAGNEASAIASLRSIHSAQVSYSASCAQGGFAVSLADLARPQVGTNATFISEDLARADVEKSGYIINITRDRSPVAADVGTAASTCNGSTNNPSSSYFARADPVTPGTTGVRYFAIDARGVIFESSHPISNPIMDSPSVVPIR